MSKPLTHPRKPQSVAQEAFVEPRHVDYLPGLAANWRLLQTATVDSQEAAHVRLPFECLKAEADKKHTRIFGKGPISRSDWGLLEDAAYDQQLAIELVAKFEGAALGSYWQCVLENAGSANGQNSGDTPGQGLHRFLSAYYYGLIRMCVAHAHELTHQLQASRDLSALARLDHKLSSDARALSNIQALEAKLEVPHYNSLTLWTFWGLHLMLEGKQAWRAWPTPREGLGADLVQYATQAAKNDYLAYLAGEHQLQAQHLERPSLLSSFIELPESMAFKLAKQS